MFCKRYLRIYIIVLLYICLLVPFSYGSTYVVYYSKKPLLKKGIQGYDYNDRYLSLSKSRKVYRFSVHPVKKRKAKWSSSNKKIISINQKGRARLKGVGACKVTYSYQTLDGKWYYAYWKVRVTDKKTKGLYPNEIPKNKKRYLKDRTKPYRFGMKGYPLRKYSNCSIDTYYNISQSMIDGEGSFKEAGTNSKRCKLYRALAGHRGGIHRPHYREENCDSNGCFDYIFLKKGTVCTLSDGEGKSKDYKVVSITQNASAINDIDGLKWYMFEHPRWIKPQFKKYIDNYLLVTYCVDEVTTYHYLECIS